MANCERIFSVLLFVSFSSVFCANGDPGLTKSCTDSDGKVIGHGEDFIPDLNDACKSCVCDNGYPILCKTAACSPPHDCLAHKPIPRTCCKFECQDSGYPSRNGNGTMGGIPSTNDESIANLSLRLVASTVTSLLVLALLLFMVHRLRQRRLMLAMRRFEAQAQQDEDEADHYIPANFLHIECPPYEDPPPPYSPPKPPHILPQELPPPYQEVEREERGGGGDVDANGNVNNNNNNNDRTCAQHGAGSNDGGGGGGGRERDGDARQVRGSPYSVVNIMDAFDVFHVSGPVDRVFPTMSTSSISNNSSGSRGDDTEMQVMSSRRESCPLERSGGGIAFHQDYPMFCTGAAAVGGASDRNQRRESAHGEESRPRGSGDGCEGNRRGASRSGGKKAGRSCSFSVPRNPPEAAPTNTGADTGLILAPMSHSYHATTSTTPTTESGVQTPGSYTASLTHRRSRTDRGEGERGVREVQREAAAGGEGSGSQRMVTKPLGRCDASMQHNHRLLQEELRRNLPPAFVNSPSDTSLKRGDGNVRPPAEPDRRVDTSSHRRLVEGGRSAVAELASRRNVVDSPGNSDKNVGNPGSSGSSAACQRHLPSSGNAVSSPDTGASPSPEHFAPRNLPRSQSSNSTFSVCSETGEVRMKKAAAEGEGGEVLRSDCQYPDHGSAPRAALNVLTPPTSPEQSGLSADSGSSSARDRSPSSLPNYTFPSVVAQYPNASDGVNVNTNSSPAENRGDRDPHITRSKSSASASAGPRRSVPNPPASQELRMEGSPSVGRSHSAKTKHKKIHFVPLEKSKTFRSKSKEKNKRKAEGGVGEASHLADCGLRTSALSHAHPHLQGGEASAEPRIHQPKLADIMRGRLAPATNPSHSKSVKQYGFVDPFPAAPQDAGYPELQIGDVARESSADRSCVGGVGGGGGGSPRTVHAGVPKTVKSSAHGSPPSVHHPQPSHRRQTSHGDTTGKAAHAATNTTPSLRPKTFKPRPLSGGPVVEAGRDPSDPAASASVVPRRRGKTLHLKKSRQSYPAHSSSATATQGASERKVMCVDLGLVEPGSEVGGRFSNNVVSFADSTALPAKRQSVDERGGGMGKLGLVAQRSVEVLEGQMSSYV